MIKREKNSEYLVFITLVLLAFFLFGFSIYAAGPGTITYQGTVSDSVGAIPPDTNYAMRFTLFNALSAGTQKWQELHTGGNAVPVTKGCFSAELGSISSFPATLFQDNANLWLEVEVDLNANGFEGTEKYSPRVPFTAAPYAFQSDRATTATFAQSALKNLIRNFVVASGESVSAGDVVVFINENVKKGPSRDFGSEYVFNSASTSYICAAALSNTKFVVAYGDFGNSWYGTAVVGAVSGNTITYRSEYVYNSADTRYISAAALSNTKFVVAYLDFGNSGYGTAVVGEVSGNTITYGSKYVYNSASTWHPSAAALSATKFVVAYGDGGNSQYGTAVVGEVSGNNITFGSEYVYNSASTDFISATALSSNKFVVAYQDVENSQYGTAVVGDVSGNVITFGSEYVYNSATTVYNSAATLYNTKFVVVYYDEGNSWYGTAVVGDVSGNVITFGSEYVYNSAITHSPSTAALSNTKFVVAYRDFGNSQYGTALVGEVSGNTITYGSEYVYNSVDTRSVSAAALSNTKFVVAYLDLGNSSYGTAVVADLGIPLGIADAAASSGETVPVILHGISDHHSSLVPGAFYYGQPDGSLTATATDTRVGVAISPTELLLDIER